MPVSDAMREAGRLAALQVHDGATPDEYRTAVFLAMKAKEEAADQSPAGEVKLSEATVRRAYEHFQHHAEAPCSASAMREAIMLALSAIKGQLSTVDEVERLWTALMGHGVVTEDGTWLACSKEEFAKILSPLSAIRNGDEGMGL